nr:uncharacterized protein LOC117683637 isoform X2 [Crassostrea gigas]
MGSLMILQSTQDHVTSHVQQLWHFTTGRNLKANPVEAHPDVPQILQNSEDLLQHIITYILVQQIQQVIKDHVAEYVQQPCIEYEIEACNGSSISIVWKELSVKVTSDLWVGFPWRST